MTRLAEVIRNARLNARLSEALAAKMVGLDERKLQQLEVGEVEPTPDELDAYAQVFGLRMREFAQGDARNAPLTHLFFRSASEGGLAGLQELVSSKAQWTLGEFMRCVRDIVEIEGLLGRPLPQKLPVPPRELLEGLDGPPPHGGDELAGWFRAELGLGLEPIPSMRSLVSDRLGVPVLWVTPEELDPVVDGASTGSPRPTILVNLVQGPQCWWRTRMTLGHELCHLLCDEGASGNRFALISPHMQDETQPRWTLFKDFGCIERRASAFAAWLLAPKEAVLRVVALRDPTSEEAIAAVGREFGLGRKAAINRLQHVFQLSKQSRQMMEARSARHWPSTDHPDRVQDPIGLRTGLLEELALEAFSAGRIDALRVREYLRLPLTELLPEHPRLTLEQRRPLRRVEDKVRGLAQQHLQKAGDDEWELFVTGVAPGEGGWRVEIGGRLAGCDDQLVPRGDLLVSYDLSHIEPRLQTSALSKAPTDL